MTIQSDVRGNKGLSGHRVDSPRLQSLGWGLGLEGTVRVLDGECASVGCTPIGIKGLGGDTRQGLDLRLDLLRNGVNA